MIRVTASGTARLTACQYWARLGVEWFDVTSEHAERGNRFHAAIARYTATGVREDVGEDIAAEYDAAVEWVEDYGRKFMRAEVAFAWDPQIDLAEQTTVADREYPQDGRLWGTADLVAVSEVTKTALVADWKTGDGSGAGPQLRTLALMAARALGLVGVTVYALEVSPAGVREVCREDLDAFDLDAHAGELAELLAAVPTAEPVPGEHCSDLYCPAKAACPAQREAAEQLVPVDALVRHTMTTTIASPDHAAWMLDRVKLVEAACKQVKEAIKAACPDEGWTLADGRVMREGSRKVERFDAKAAQALLRELGATDEQLAGLYYQAEESAGLRVTGGASKPRKSRGKAAA